MVNNSTSMWRLFWTLINEWFCTTFIQLYIIHTFLIFRNNNNNHHNQGKLNKKEL